MKSVREVVRGVLERMLGRLTDGPSPPPRLREAVIVFRVMYPTASIDEWEAFAIAQAEDAYRSGFVRGLEWSERELDNMDPDTPERLAEAASHDWSLAESSPSLREMLDKRYDPRDPFAHVPPEDRAAFVDQLGEYFGGFRVVVLPDERVDPDDPDAP